MTTWLAESRVGVTSAIQEEMGFKPQERPERKKNRRRGSIIGIAESISFSAWVW